MGVRVSRGGRGAGTGDECGGSPKVPSIPLVLPMEISMLWPVVGLR